MKLLLDTHIWIWSLDDPKRLKPAVVKALRNPRTELWLSSISVWEATLLLDRGRIRVKGKTT
ncbi:MAG TPA: hypothetical protein VHE30_26125, partial [Polyangiaceae bacterium]|nr:hypothetical protein [Polyangiaceae bacterium]